jgi:hypothetical protein
MDDNKRALIAGGKLKINYCVIFVSPVSLKY